MALSLVITPATAAVSFKGGMEASGSEGKKIFNSRCSICHGVDGRGNTANGKKLKAKDLLAPEVQSQSDDALMETISEGMGRNMPGFGKKLDQEQLQQVLGYIRELGKS